MIKQQSGSIINIILTPLTVPTWEHPQHSAYLKERIAMQRLGTPEEIVDLRCIRLHHRYIIRLDGAAWPAGRLGPFDTKY